MICLFSAISLAERRVRSEGSTEDRICDKVKLSLAGHSGRAV
jgi:hypothetical protein